MMSFPIQLSLLRANTAGVDLSKMKAFLKKVEERPAYQRAKEKGGPMEGVNL
jgi:hypothetical protein